MTFFVLYNYFWERLNNKNEIITNISSAGCWYVIFYLGMYYEAAATYSNVLKEYGSFCYRS